ncbi:type II toxin-antitoxin system PemK/MazF family toxin [uncultured Fenollaria sp.]|uniref:type II toxin-antitoxin system PemK/MazF family toxin n=1 Tax=uncultured Fenollaria sp. TaxID=1686315 RepID=UPI00345BC621
MVEQGDIIKLSFNPQKGHEQAGFRPALVISNKVFNKNTNLAILCPITNTDNKFPLHVPLDIRLKLLASFYVNTLNHWTLMQERMFLSRNALKIS